MSDQNKVEVIHTLPVSEIAVRLVAMRLDTERGWAFGAQYGDLPFDREAPPSFVLSDEEIDALCAWRLRKNPHLLPSILSGVEGARVTEGILKEHSTSGLSNYHIGPHPLTAVLDEFDSTNVTLILLPHQDGESTGEGQG